MHEDKNSTEYQNNPHFFRTFHEIPLRIGSRRGKVRRDIWKMWKKSTDFMEKI